MFVPGLFIRSICCCSRAILGRRYHSKLIWLMSLIVSEDVTAIHHHTAPEIRISNFLLIAMPVGSQ